MSTVHRIARRLTAPRFLRWVVAPHIAFFIVAWLTDAPALIAVLNSIDIALSVAVCIAFLPSALDAVFQDGPADKAVFLTLGIFCGWEGNAIRSGWSMAWRAFGMPDWFANTDITSYILFVIGAGALFHLLAPGALDEQVPPKRWVKIGAWVGIGVLLAITLTRLQDIETLVHRLAPPHDWQAAPTRFDDL